MQVAQGRSMLPAQWVRQYPTDESRRCKPDPPRGEGSARVYVDHTTRLRRGMMRMDINNFVHSVWSYRRENCRNCMRLLRHSHFLQPREASFCFSGTGSKPLPPQGWQRHIRFIASHPPRTGPNRSTASTAYCEHVGVKRHAAGKCGETAS